jgi:hypothetical protein
MVPPAQFVLDHEALAGTRPEFGDDAGGDISAPPTPKPTMRRIGATAKCPSDGGGLQSRKRHGRGDLIANIP